LPRSPTTSRRRNALSRERIADAALDLVDREGIDALTMRRLAGELGVGTMTLYGYFRDKEELVEQAIDRAARRYELSPGEGHWRERLRELIRTVWRSLSEHPSVVQARSRKPILNPGALRAFEAGATILRDAGFDAREIGIAWRLLFTYVFGYAAFSSYEPTDEQRAGWREELGELPAGDYPVTVADADEFASWMAGREPFEQGLDLILDGLEARLAQKTGDSV
jgi:AcrR family transcriptional regulator